MDRSNELTSVGFHFKIIFLAQINLPIRNINVAAIFPGNLNQSVVGGKEQP
jgi:hypothetical protein